jgi:hypothetical protein
VRGDDTNIVVRLMMACNDMTFANQCLSAAKSEDHGYLDDSIARAASMYFVRIHMSHLWEGLKVIDDIVKSPRLVSLVERCDDRTRTSFALLKDYRRGGSRHTRIEKILGQLRHNLGFHYHESGRWIARALEDCASHSAERFSSITRGSDAYSWRFSVADQVVDHIIVRQIWQIPRGPDTPAKADEVAEEIHHLFLAFVDFCGEFIWKYCEK